MKSTKSIIVCTPFYNQDWTWFSSSFNQEQFDWVFYYLKPKNILEKYIKQPEITMIRTCKEAMQDAKEKKADLIITHDPRVSFWCAFFAKRLKLNIEHIAWSFNFPELPKGFKRSIMKKAFQDINQFVVYSQLEKQLYSDFFGLPANRFQINFWGVNTPKFAPDIPLEKESYICAIGGNARDYQTLMEAMEKLPHIPLVLVARPQNIRNLSIPKNVKVLVNIPKLQAMNILKFSRFMVLPLIGSEVPCGHVTLVAAMHLSKAFIITNSSGVKDYVKEDINALTCEPLSPNSIALTIDKLWNNPSQCKELGKNGKEFAENYCSEQSAYRYLRNLLSEKFPDTI